MNVEELEILTEKLFRAIKEVFKEVEAVADVMKRFNKEVYEVLDRIFRKQCDYPPYKTKYRTVRFFTKKIYYNCRNTC